MQDYPTGLKTLAVNIDISFDLSEQDSQVTEDSSKTIAIRVEIVRSMCGCNCS